MQNENILKSWILVESMNPPEIKKPKDKILTLTKDEDTYREKIKTIKGFKLDNTPWDNPYSLAENKEIEYTCYLGVYRSFLITEIVQKYFLNEPEELFNLDKSKKTYAAKINLDKDGSYIDGSLYLPHISYVLSKMQAKKAMIDFSTINTDFNKLEAFIQEKTTELFNNGVTEKSISAFEDLLKEKLFLDVDGLRKDTYLDPCYVQYHVKNVGEESEFETNFNSFFLEDLQHIIQKGNYPEALNQYLHGSPKSKRKNIDENRGLINEILEPENIPIARWPSPVEHRLSLMQQVSVNLALNPDKKGPIHSVNGPPGTGKTTLLKDIFANLVSERALHMCALKNPIDAFQYDKLKVEGESTAYFTLKKDIQGYSMVVVSSNNTAVENISNDLPLKEEVIRKQQAKQDDKYAIMEQEYASIAMDLDLFRSTASLLKNNDTKPAENIGGDVWGLFSIALGNKKNFDNFNDNILGKMGESFVKQITKKKYSLLDWKKETTELQRIKEEIITEKEGLQDLSKAHHSYQKDKGTLKAHERSYESLTETINSLEQELGEIISSKADYREKLQFEPKPNAIATFFSKAKREQAKKREQTLSKLSQLKQTEMDTKRKIQQQEHEQRRILKETKKIQHKNAAYHHLLNQYDDQNIVIPDEAYWANESYKERQLNTPWLTDNLLHLRALLFLQAMKVHEVFIYMSFYQIKQNLSIFEKRNLIDINREVILGNLWNTIHLFLPVVSTTFASVGRMYKELGPGSIDYLFIDEAGQAVPQAAAGAIWRSKNVMAVGDPLQIEPVVTMDQTLLSAIQESFHLPDAYIISSASVQSLADKANPYGMYKGAEWIGIPLWVHRRCLDPMFTISNQMAYENKMVLASNKRFNPQDGLGLSRWVACKGKATSKQYVKEQGEAVWSYVKSSIDQGPDSEDLPDIFVITPFTEVKIEIRSLLKSRFKNGKFDKEKVKTWLDKRVGTVHTFQGKEAGTVLFVCGTDDKQEGAANWICRKPNLLNVAVTRAKERFIIIGDRERLKRKNHFDLLDQHLKTSNESIKI